MYFHDYCSYCGVYELVQIESIDNKGEVITLCDKCIEEQDRIFVKYEKDHDCAEEFDWVEV